jgi:heme/copper-type cytochrome/quinol oxidase subunit 3
MSGVNPGGVTPGMSGVTPGGAGPGQLTRSTSAQAGAGAATVAQRRRAAPNGMWGMALFLSAEITLFGTMLATYFYLDFDAPRWPPAGIKPPSIFDPSLATGILLLTSIPMWMASRAARQGARQRVLWLVFGAMFVQGCYLAAQILMFRHDLNQFRPQDTAYGSIYFTILATHHAHVLLGLLLDGSVLAFVLLRGLTNYWLTAVRNIAIYWHVVNALAIFVLVTQLAPSL